MASVDEEEDTVQWSVMGVVSCIPLIDWTVSAPPVACAAACSTACFQARYPDQHGVLHDGGAVGPLGCAEHVPLFGLGRHGSLQR